MLSATHGAVLPFSAGEAAARAASSSGHRAWERQRQLHKCETLGLLCENPTRRQPGGKKGGGLSPRESKVGAEAPGNVPDGLISPPP